VSLAINIDFLGLVDTRRISRLEQLTTSRMNLPLNRNALCLLDGRWLLRWLQCWRGRDMLLAPYINLLRLVDWRRYRRRRQLFLPTLLEVSLAVNDDVLRLLDCWRPV
jgi:hypothetical protein